MFDEFFKKSLKQLPVVGGKSIYLVDFNEKNFKLEMQAKESNPLGERYQDIIGMRLWINTDAKASTAFDKNDNPFAQKIQVIKSKGDVLDRYEIHPNSYNIFIKKFPEISDAYDNPKWHTSFDEIKDKELTNYTIARIKQFEQAQQEGQPVFLRPNEDLLLQLADFSNISFEKVKPWTKEQKQKINEALKKLYLKDSDVAKISEWTLLDLFEKGKVKPKSETCGVILYGPAGTGKTVTVNESLKYIFQDILDFKFVDIPIGNLVGGENSGIVGGFAKTLAEVYRGAFDYISKNRKPYVIFIDEGDDLIEDVSGKDDNGSKWLHQGQVILKNYMNPKRYPGVIFIISTNLSAPEKFYSPFRDQRLGVVYFPIPTFERYQSLFSDVNYSGSLQNKLFEGIERVLTFEEINILSKVCADKVTLRITALSCERFNKNVVKKTGKFDFKEFEDFLIEESIKETNISKANDIDKAREKGDQKKYDELITRYNYLLKELDLLKRGISAEEDRALRAKKDLENNEDIEKQYINIFEILTNLISAYRSNTDIVNDQNNFLKPLGDVSLKINLFSQNFELDLRITPQNKQYLSQVLPILNQLILKIVNKNDVEGDFLKLVQIVERLPSNRQIFHNESEGSSIFLGR